MSKNVILNSKVSVNEWDCAYLQDMYFVKFRVGDSIGYVIAERTFDGYYPVSAECMADFYYDEIIDVIPLYVVLEKIY